MTFTIDFHEDVTVNYEILKGLQRKDVEKINALFALLIWSTSTAILITCITVLMNATDICGELTPSQLYRKSRFQFVADFFIVLVLGIPLLTCMVNEYDIRYAYGTSSGIYH